MTNRAREFAALAHAGTKYGSGLPYTAHLDEVVSVLYEFGFGEAAGVGYLHDTIEDTTVTYEELVSHFGEEVAKAVWFCSDEPGATRAERKEETIEKWKRELATGASYLKLAVPAKVADRLANTRACVRTGHSLLKRYREEHPEFRAALFSPEHSALWEALEKLLVL